MNVTRPQTVGYAFLFAYVFLLLIVLCATASGAASTPCPYSAAAVETAMEEAKTWRDMQNKLPKQCPGEHLNIVRSICERLESRFPPEEGRSGVVADKLRRCHAYLDIHKGQELHGSAMWDSNWRRDRDWRVGDGTQRPPLLFSAAATSNRFESRRSASTSLCMPQ